MYKHIVHKNWETLSHSFNHGAYTSIWDDMSATACPWAARYKRSFISSARKVLFICFLLVLSCWVAKPTDWSNDASRFIQGTCQMTFKDRTLQQCIGPKMLLFKVQPLNWPSNTVEPNNQKKESVWNLCTCIELFTTRNGTRGIYSWELIFSQKAPLKDLRSMSNKFQMQAGNCNIVLGAFNLH